MNPKSSRGYFHSWGGFSFNYRLCSTSLLTHPRSRLVKSTRRSLAQKPLPEWLRPCKCPLSLFWDQTCLTHIVEFFKWEILSYIQTFLRIILINMLTKCNTSNVTYITISYLSYNMIYLSKVIFSN